MEALRFFKMPAAGGFCPRWSLVLNVFSVLSAENWDLKNFQHWVKLSAHQFHFSHLVIKSHLRRGVTNITTTNRRIIQWQIKKAGKCLKSLAPAISAAELMRDRWPKLFAPSPLVDTSKRHLSYAYNFMQIKLNFSHWTRPLHVSKSYRPFQCYRKLSSFHQHHVALLLLVGGDVRVAWK